MASSGSAKDTKSGCSRPQKSAPIDIKAAAVVTPAKASKMVATCPLFSKVLSVSVIKNHFFYELLDTKSLAAFKTSSHYANQSITQAALLEKGGLKTLFAHICSGEIDKVKKMLKTSPGLALAKWKADEKKETIITNKAGQHIYIEGKTAYQLALGEEDYEMAWIIRNKILKVADEKEAVAQFNAQFPEGWEEDEQKRWGEAFNILAVLIEVTKNASPEDITDPAHEDEEKNLRAIKKLDKDALMRMFSSPKQIIRNSNQEDMALFRSPKYKLVVKEGSDVALAEIEFKKALNTILNTPLKTGRHYNLKLLEEVFLEYDRYSDSNRYSNNLQHRTPIEKFFWQRIVGYVERLMPANCIQAFCSYEEDYKTDKDYGLFSYKEKLDCNYAALQNRSLKVKVCHPYPALEPKWIICDFYLLLNSGFDFAICPYGKATTHFHEGIIGSLFSESSQNYLTAKERMHKTCRQPIAPGGGRYWFFPPEGDADFQPAAAAKSPSA